MTGADKPPSVVMKEQVEQILAMVTTLTESQGQAATDGLLGQLKGHAFGTQALVDCTKTLETTLADLETIVEALSAKINMTPPSKDIDLLIADCRDTITEGIGALHTQGAEMLHALQILQAPPAPPRRPKQPRWVAVGVGLVVGVALMGMTWWGWPDGGYRAFLVGLDAVLVTHHPQLPPPVQEAVAAVYGWHQFQTPGSRQKGK